jgi:cytidylate kinase
MTMIRVITIAREYGSGGGLIGQELASRLGWKLLDRELITELARRAHLAPADVARLDEHPRSFIAQLMKAFWRGNIETWSAPLPPDVVDQDYLARLSAMVIEEAAGLGRCVMVGRGAQCILRRRDIFNVFVYGSTEEKLKRLQRRHSSLQNARAAIQEMDRVRAAYIRTYYHCSWDDRHLYNLMINSDVGVDRAVDAILCTAGLSQQEKH